VEGTVSGKYSAAVRCLFVCLFVCLFFVHRAGGKKTKGVLGARYRAVWQVSPKLSDYLLLQSSVQFVPA
jgi:hypothetical protein